MTTPHDNDITNLPHPPELFQMEVGLLQNFCEILSCPETGEAAIVDPAWEVDRLLAEANRRGLKITKALITHGHNDHVEGVASLVAQTGATIVVNAGELERVRHELGDATATLELVADRQDVTIGRRGVRALFTPGHTVGGTCFLADGYLISGDVLFVGGCGRTDFPGGDTALMWQSLQRLALLPEETRVYPGHDYGTTPTSTMGRELLENPYLRAATLPDFRALRDRRR
ncbi:MAG TPA: MBL fold metallo-hydrolase [Polyangia bacterium]|jgi:glyoxylase-like metal-dependent hydrolase (beta-lactamase superfamily II)